MRQPETLFSIALQAVSDHGGPEHMTTAMHRAILAALQALGASPEQAEHHVAAAIAQHMAEVMPGSAWVDVDLCTAHMVAIRQTGSAPRYVPLSAIQLIVGAAMQQQPTTTTTTPPAPHDKTIH